MVLFSRDRAVDWSQQDNPFKEALCRKFGIPLRTYDPWFDDFGEAMSICNGWSGGPVCPMRQRCLKRALLNNEQWGVWGGMLLHDRKALKQLHPDPEDWQWHPPTYPAPRRRRAATPPDGDSTPCSTTAKPPPSFSETSASTCFAAPEPNNSATVLSCIQARSASLSGAPAPHITSFATA